MSKGRGCRLILVAACLVATACAHRGTHQTPDGAEPAASHPTANTVPNRVERSAQMPAISLFRLPAQRLEDRCGSAGSGPAAPCLLNPLAYDRLQQALSAAGQFEEVALADPDNDYSVVLASVVYTAQNSNRRALEVLADVYWFDRRLAEVRARTTLEGAGGLTGAQRFENDPERPQWYADIASALVEQLQATQVFSKELLHATVQSSRYAEELKAAAEIGAFHFRGMQVLHNPAYGASLRYLHTAYEDAYLDVFVYPILDWQYQAPGRLDAELEALRHELADIERQGLWRDLRLNGAVELLLAADIRALAFDGDYRSNDGALLGTTAHLFVSRDKFVKVRASYPKFAPVRRDVDDFVRRLPTSLVVPDESVFMAELRRAWRLADSATLED